MLSTSFLALLLVATAAYGQTIINIIQFSDDYCLCPNQQKLSLVDECLPVLGGYQVYKIVDGTPDQIYIQDCSDKACTQCTNQTIYPALPPCQADKSGLFFYSVLPEDDVTTYFNAPSIVTSRYANASCGGDVVHLEISYGLSCFPTATGSYYYACPEGVTTEYSYFNCSDNACLECEENTMPTEQCTNDEGVWKSVMCTPSSSTSTTQTSVSTSQTSVTSGQTNANNVNTASATVSTTTSASSHNVSSSASATAGTATSSSGKGAVPHAIYSDVRGGMMIRKANKAPRSNPPFCNGGLPATSTATSQTSQTSVSTSGTDGSTSGTAGTATATGGSSGGSSGGSGGSGGDGRHRKHGIVIVK